MYNVNYVRKVLELSMNTRNIKNKNIQMKFLSVKILQVGNVNAETNFAGFSMRKERNLNRNIMIMLNKLKRIKY